jgi:tRNA pseudouridine38-40 synthase
MSINMPVRIILGVEYDGTRFAGWQIQIGKRTVQGVLEQALSIVAHHPVTVMRALQAWMMGGNRYLPEDVRIIWVKPALDDFHARYSAVARFYRYIILNRAMTSALSREQVTHYSYTLDAEKMHQAAQALCGNHDFSSFRAQGCQSKSPQRLMYFIDVYRQEQHVIIDLSANAFLHHMVRNIAGVLMEIGAGKKSITWTQTLLAVKDRSQGGITASPHGLHLAGVYYPEQYGLDKHPIFNKLPPDAHRFD